ADYRAAGLRRTWPAGAEYACRPDVRGDPGRAQGASGTRADRPGERRRPGLTMAAPSAPAVLAVPARAAAPAAMAVAAVVAGAVGCGWPGAARMQCKERRIRRT